MVDRFDAYLKKLRETPIKEHTEHTGRSALEALLNQFAPIGMVVQHEPKRKQGSGAPDFKVTKGGTIVGYVEVKPVGEKLDDVLKSDQMERYRKLSDDIILTNYLEWIWVDRKGKREVLAFPSDLESRSFHVAPQRADAVEKIITGFFSEPPKGIGTSQELAKALAVRSRLLRDELIEELNRQIKDELPGRLAGLLGVFRKQVFQELTVKEFSDAFAQMLAYGLFLAKLNAAESAVVNLDNVRKHIPGSFQLIRELVQFLEDLENDEYVGMRWIERDPFVYFYEDYLKEFDPTERKRRGVYYTPPPIVNFIVRGVDDILKDSFGIPHGLADHNRVTVLDFACGTGTFLLEVFERIFENIGGHDAGIADKVVREHLLKNIYGFEYLIAPYTIAHLKLSQYLKDKDYELRGKERLKIYLTNTLEPVEPDPIPGVLPAIASEAKEAQEIKDRKILVILGNPPYSGHSKNKGLWITDSISEYKYTLEKSTSGLIERKPLGERNPKWLQDDYVKFIRFAQMKMDGFTYKIKAPDGKIFEHSVEGVKNGIVGVITNHSWLDNPTFRGMRQSLMRTFNQIYVLDLHGYTKKKEVAPDGSKDENVFDIEQGVAISLFVKMPDLEPGVWRSDLWGKRIDKYKATANGALGAVCWERLEPVAPFYLFARQNLDIRAEYNQGMPVNQIFQASSVGIATARDGLTIHFTKDAVMSVARDFASLDVEVARAKYRLGKDVEDWRVEWAQDDLRESGINREHAEEILYRPFDVRWTYYTGNSRGFHCRPRSEIMKHLLQGNNLALITSRLTKGETFKHVQITDKITEVICMSPNTSNNGFIFPLFLRDEAGKLTENLSENFRIFLASRYDHSYTPEEILGYIYAVLHAPAYRERYAEFLRGDFPRILFPEDAADFQMLSALGWKLAQVHLLGDGQRRDDLGRYHGKGDDVVELIQYAASEQAICINPMQCFKPIPQEIWDLQIGGYQVLAKYLKSRKGRSLSLDEITHIGAITNALAFTIEQMQRIDEAYLQAFPGRG